MRISRVASAICALALACAREPAAPTPTAAVPKNVILIVLDTLRADHLSSYGYPRATSPNLDGFGRDNARFEQVRSQAACTFPSVNSILTSRSGFNFLGQPARGIGIPERFAVLPELLRAQGMHTIAISASLIVRRTPSHFNQHGGFERGFDIFDEQCELRVADCINQRARRYLNHTDGPFFLYLHYMDAHSPYYAPQPFTERFATPFEGRAWLKVGNPRLLINGQTGKGPRVEVSALDLQRLKDLYDGEIAYMDSKLGELLADLRARGLFESSIIIIAADHGEEFMEHGCSLHCNNVFETTIRVPLFVHVPGLEARPPITDLVENLDILPTVFDYLGLAKPPEAEGTSLRALLDGRASPPRPAFSMQHQLRSATDGRNKLVLDLKTGESALYDLIADPGETTNVMTSARPAFHTLHAQMAAWLQRVEGSPTAEHSLAISEESRKRLEALGYLQ